MQRRLTVSTANGSIRRARSELRRNKVSAVLFVVSMLLTLFILKFTPPTRAVTSLPSFLFKLLPFLLSAEAIARLKLAKPLREFLCRLTIPISFLGFFCYFVPRNFYLLDEFAQDYVNMLQAVPYLILCLLFAYRIGGGSTIIVRRLAIAMLLLMLSGLEDLAFLLINDNSGTPYAGIPKVWFWASHMAIFIGHYPSRSQAFAFIGVHVSLATTALFAPTRWFTRLLPLRLQGTRPAPSSSARPAASAMRSEIPAARRTPVVVDQKVVRLYVPDAPAVADAPAEPGEPAEEEYVGRHLRPAGDTITGFNWNVGS